jgi:hypothetical protein
LRIDAPCFAINQRTAPTTAVRDPKLLPAVLDSDVKGLAFDAARTTVRAEKTTRLSQGRHRIFES